MIEKDENEKSTNFLYMEKSEKHILLPGKIASKLPYHNINVYFIKNCLSIV